MASSMVAVFATAAAVWFGPQAAAKRTDSAIRRAVPIRQALSSWLADNQDQRSCPTTSQLVFEKYLARDAPIEDPWGERFRIDCESTPSVVSPGPDKVLGSSDDLVLRVED